MLQRIIILITLVVLLAPAGGADLAARQPPATPEAATPFYDPPPDLGTLHPGDLLRSEEIAPPGPDVRLWRILYVSTDIDDRPASISALLAVPSAPPPADGYPLVTVGHGSIGVAPQCAPSIDPGGAESYNLLVEPLVSAGYVVVMSDYQGLGAPGDSSFLVGTLEGRNLLDAARAAVTFPDLRLQPGIVIWGHSQGGHAALFAAHLAPDYAPELDLRGVVAEAPVTDLGTMFTNLMEAGERGGILSLALMTADAWAHVYPDVDLDSLLTPRGQRRLDAVIRRFCLTPAFLATQLDRPGDLIRPGTFGRLAPVVAANTPPASYTMPVLIVQGEADDVVHNEITRRAANEMCDAGTNLTYRSYPGAGHLEVIAASLGDVLSWMESVRSGDVPPPSCGA